MLIRQEHICVTAGAVREFGCGSAQYAQIYFDAERKMLGISFSERKERGSYKIRNQGTYYLNAASIIHDLRLAVGEYRASLDSQALGTKGKTLVVIGPVKQEKK